MIFAKHWQSTSYIHKNQTLCLDHVFFFWSEISHVTVMKNPVTLAKIAVNYLWCRMCFVLWWYLCAFSVVISWHIRIESKINVIYFCIFLCTICGMQIVTSAKLSFVTNGEAVTDVDIFGSADIVITEAMTINGDSCKCLDVVDFQNLINLINNTWYTNNRSATKLKCCTCFLEDLKTWSW